jgi:hypothetical protein
LELYHWLKGVPEVEVLTAFLEHFFRPNYLLEARVV